MERTVTSPFCATLDYWAYHGGAQQYSIKLLRDYFIGG